jgi:threonylcarbamoyladenosine tRNA methylthiotransferase MtaB
MARPRIALVTFGCRVNQYETEIMRERLRPEFEISDGPPADAFIINACTVTQLAEKKARQAANRMRAACPEAKIILCGCLADAVDRGWSRFPNADLTAGGAWKPRIAEVVAFALAGRTGSLPPSPPAGLDTESAHGRPARVRAYLKVQDGCSRACTYCRPTQLRGPSRSKSLAVTVSEATRLVEQGATELVLTGINLAEYAPEHGGLPILLRRLLGVPRLHRIRLASLDLSGIDDSLLDVFAEDSRLCPHFHLPLQSGSDRILRRMGRPYTADEYLTALRRVRQRIPGASFGTDIIVGFPGEEDQDFLETLRTIDVARFSNLHVFRYSPRPGTPAAEFAGRVPEAVQRERASRVASVWAPIRRRTLDERIGKTEDVLVEERRDGRFRGYTSDYLFVSFISCVEQATGTLCPVRITGATVEGLKGVTEDRSGSG